MRYKIVFSALMAAMNVSAQESENADTSYVFKKDLDGVTVVAHNEIRKMREAAMPVTVLGKRQLEGTTTSILTMRLLEPLVLRLEVPEVLVVPHEYPCAVLRENEWEFILTRLP